jgi:hypothetical protein
MGGPDVEDYRSGSYFRFGSGFSVALGLYAILDFRFEVWIRAATEDL